MNFNTRLPPSYGFILIMVVVDRLLKYSHFSRLKIDYTSKQVANSFVTTVVKLHGILKSLLPERGQGIH